MKKKNFKTKDMITVSLAAALICICSWIQVPSAVPFTLQTFAVFLVADLLGTKKGTAATLVYLLLGTVGLPVFSGFQGGIGTLLGSTGGYVFGFVLSALTVGIAADKFADKLHWKILLNIVAVLLCYAVGTLWFAFIYGNGNLTGALTVCVLPFIIPDAVKITLAMLVAKKIKPMMKY